MARPTYAEALALGDPLKLLASLVAESGPDGTAFGGPVTATDAGSGTDDEAIAAPADGLVLKGLSVYETAGSTASLIVHNGNDAADPALVAITLTANESRALWFDLGGIAADGGIFLERVTGNTRVIVYHITGG